MLAAVKTACDGKARCSLVVASPKALGGVVPDPNGTCPAVALPLPAKRLAVQTSRCYPSSAAESDDTFRLHFATFLLGRGDYNWMGFS